MPSDLDPPLAAESTPTCAPVLVGTRLRGGTANSARGAASFLTEAITTARAAGATGLLIARMDSAFYTGATIAACRRKGVRFSVTARMDRKITNAIAGIDEHAWTPIRYPNAIFDEDEQRWISDAEVAEIAYTAFAGKKAHAVTARLIVRRVRRLGPPAQGELLPAWRHHGVFTDSPLPDARRGGRPPRPRHHRTAHRRPRRRTPGIPALRPFAANAAWLTCAGIAHNLLRAAATLASRRHGKARGATVRRELINVAARLAHPQPERTRRRIVSGEPSMPPTNQKIINPRKRSHHIGRWIQAQSM